jgi:hypothetical protein
MKIRWKSWALLTSVAISALGCNVPLKQHNLPPAQMLAEPGPGVGGPGPGVLAPHAPPPGYGAPLMLPTVQVDLAATPAMEVTYDMAGVGQFDSEPLVVPAKLNFPQGFIYRLKLTNIEGREGVELYPTLEVANATPRSEAFLAHAAIPIAFTEEDFDQVAAGNFVTKVIYLPDAEYQDLAVAGGLQTLVSTRLDPGVDPIVEADKRGVILAIIRIGGKDLEMPGMEGGPVDMGGGMGGVPCGPGMAGPAGLPPQYLAGVTAPQYGHPYTGTPIGLPGPPHIPLGVPAGLQKHVIKNNTHVHLPEPPSNVRIAVRQQPGLSYPKPPNHVRVREQSIHPAPAFGLPRAEARN